MTMYKQGIDATTLPLPLYFAKRIPFKLIFRKAVYESQSIITPSQAVKDELIEHFKIPEGKVIVTYEGVTGAKGNIGRSGLLGKYGLEEKKYFLYVGNVYPHKNVKRAIEAIRSLNQELRIKNQGKRRILKQVQDDVLLVIVSGRGVFRHRLEKQIEKLGAKEYVKIINFVPDEELTVLYKNSLAFVFPSLSEGFGLPGLEALQAGTLLLASNIPVFREVYKDSAVYFDPRDVGSIKKRMVRVIGGVREKKIREGKKLLKDYSWEKMARETKEVYRDLLSK
jgi:glycosyltransferase involved in cell wall biosynthesis